MEPSIARPDRKGFTLVEVLVGMVILLLGLLGSLVGILAVVDYNANNAVRQEAVKIAQEVMEDSRNQTYGSLSLGTTVLPTVQRQFRKWQQSYQVTRTVQKNPTTDFTRKIQVTVQWTYRGRNHSYSLESIVKRPQ